LFVVLAMSDCIQLIVHFVSLDFCIFSAGHWNKHLQETCPTGQLTWQKFLAGASVPVKNLRASTFTLNARVFVDDFRERARFQRGAMAC
jgi:hypothetical protein